MNAEKIASIFGAIVTVAMVTTVVANPGSAQVIRSLGDAFAGSLRAALGR